MQQLYMETVMGAENGKLKRAAILLFHRNPEKWVTGAYIKIGYFGEGSDLRYQDEIHGSLFIQADRVIELIYLKYMKAMISYDNVTRIETYPRWFRYRSGYMRTRYISVMTAFFRSDGLWKH